MSTLPLIRRALVSKVKVIIVAFNGSSVVLSDEGGGILF